MITATFKSLTNSNNLTIYLLGIRKGVRKMNDIPELQEIKNRLNELIERTKNIEERLDGIGGHLNDVEDVAMGLEEKVWILEYSK